MKHCLCLFLFIPGFLFSQDFEIDALTGYNSILVENLNVIYSPLIYSYPDSYEELSTEPLILELERMADDISKIYDEYYNFENEILAFIDLINDSKIIIVESRFERITDCVKFIYPETSDSTQPPLFVINPDLLENGPYTLLESSLVREIIITNRYFDRIENNTFTRWDEVENLLYMFDGYYAQARFINSYYLKNHIKITRFESFLVFSYFEDTLDSFFMYFYGIDKALMVNGTFTLYQYLSNEIDIDDLLQKYSMYSNYLMEYSHSGIENDHFGLAQRYTLICFYVFYLNHMRIKESINNQNSYEYEALFQNIINTCVVTSPARDEFQEYIMGFQNNPEFYELAQ